MKYAVTLASFRDIESMEDTLERISGTDSFDAVEMYGEPDKVDAKQLGELFGSHGVRVCGVTGMWGAAAAAKGNGEKRELLSAGAETRKEAENYVKKCVQLCRSLGGKHFNICLFADDGLSSSLLLSAFDKTHRIIPAQKKTAALDAAVPTLKGLAGFAADHGVTLVVEPLNRYSTPYCSNAQDALYVASRVDHEHLKIMLDTFHMNIEEDSFEHTISKSKDMLAHMHFADNNRKMPGYGHIDFSAIMGALVRAGYDRYVTFEPTLQNDYTDQLKNGLQFVKSLENTVK
ncbi:MAG: sugar phosphate isomerase/epimerase family protein [Nitrososphaera sp.]|jgi:D-psicose/D-tagatose/L-ribulose 3-epimerase